MKLSWLLDGCLAERSAEIRPVSVRVGATRGRHSPSPKRTCIATCFEMDPVLVPHRSVGLIPDECRIGPICTRTRVRSGPKFVATWDDVVLTNNKMICLDSLVGLTAQWRSLFCSRVYFIWFKTRNTGVASSSSLFPDEQVSHKNVLLAYPPVRFSVPKPPRLLTNVECTKITKCRQTAMYRTLCRKNELTQKIKYKSCRDVHVYLLYRIVISNIKLKKKICTKVYLFCFLLFFLL